MTLFAVFQIFLSLFYRLIETLSSFVIPLLFIVDDSRALIIIKAFEVDAPIALGGTFGVGVEQGCYQCQLTHINSRCVLKSMTAFLRAASTSPPSHLVTFPEGSSAQPLFAVIAQTFAALCFLFLTTLVREVTLALIVSIIAQASEANAFAFHRQPVLQATLCFVFGFHFDMIFMIACLSRPWYHVELNALLQESPRAQSC